MRAGDLNKRITIQHSTRVSDGMGGFVVSWVDQATIWAAIWPISASETVQAAQPTMTISHRIRIRYRNNLKPSNRLKFGNRYFNIVSIIDPNEKHELLDVMVKEAA